MPRRTQGEKKKKTERALRRHPPLQPRPLLLSPTMLLTGMESAATHVSDQVQPASSVSKLQAPGKPTESTFIAGDPVTECVIHYSLICSPDPSPSPRLPPNVASRSCEPSLGRLGSLIESVVLLTCVCCLFVFTSCSRQALEPHGLRFLLGRANEVSAVRSHISARHFSALRV